MAIIGAPFDDAVSHRSGARFGPRAIREAQYTSGSINSLQLDVEPFEVLTVVDAGDANIVPVVDRPRPRPHLPQGPRGRRDRRHPDRPGRRPLDHLAVGHGHRRGPPPGQHRHRPLRRPRRHGQRRLGRAGRPRHADAPTHRVGRGQGQELRAGRAAWLLAAGRDVPVDAGAGAALPLHARDRGARRRGGHRPGHRRGARRPGLRLPEPRHRRHRPGPRAGHGHARAGRHAHPRGPARRSARSSRRSTCAAWTSSRSRRRTTTPRRRRWPPTGPPSRPSAPWPCARRDGKAVRWTGPRQRRPASAG